MRRAAVLALPAAVAAVAGGCGGGEDRRAAPREGGRDPFADITGRPAASGEGVRAAPRWEEVADLRGTAPAGHEVRIAPRAIQWRVRWTCRDGVLRVAADPGGRLLDAGCPGAGEASAVTNGRVRLRVDAATSWRLRVEQQVDTPLREPPLPQIADGSARRLGGGRFASLERRTRGRARLFTLPDGRLALRLEDFVTAASADLFVWISTASRPRTSRAALRRRHVELGPLKATAGDQNYVLPRSIRRADARSVVIWCEPIRIAYGAAPLT